jgi:hypothetical protein
LLAIEILPEADQKKQPSDTKLLEVVEVTVTQVKHEAMSENADTKNFNSNLKLTASDTG